MNRLKSMFITIYPMAAMAAAGYSFYYQSLYGFSLAWLGVILSTLPMLLLIMWLLLFKNVARTSQHFPLFTLLGFIGLGLALFDFSNGRSSLLAVELSAAGLLIFLVYDYWYSSLGRTQSNQLVKGKILAEFEVRNEKGELVSSTSFLGNPAIFVFFRGNWCPLCMAQIKEIVAQYEILAKFGCEVAFISPQPEKNTAKLAAKFGLNLHFFSDKNNLAAKKLGIEMKNGLPMGMELLGYDSDTVLPTVVITDSNGKIIYSDQTNNYRIRPEPKDFIKVLKSQASFS